MNKHSLIFFLTLPVLTSIVRAGVAEWEASVRSGPLTTANYFLADYGSAISGNNPQVYDVGAFTGPRSFEFIVNAGDAGASSALMGLAGQQGLKFEQYNNAGHIGITNFGVADNDSDVPCPLNKDTQIVFTCDETDTQVYVNGTLQYTFGGVPVTLSGKVALGAVSDELGTTWTDRLDGHILGFASYDTVLAPTLIAQHAAALAQGAVPLNLPAWQAAVTSGTSPLLTNFGTVSGMEPVLVNLGEDDGSPRTYEFVVYSGDASASGALLGRLTQQALKLEQWQNSHSVGLTIYGVSDYNSGIPTPYYTTALVAYVFDGTNTILYINGVEEFTFEGVSLTVSGYQGLGATAMVTGDTGVTTFWDPLDGAVLRFASYDRELTEAEVGAHSTAFAADAGAQTFTSWQALVNTSTAAARNFEPVSGTDQFTLDVGPLTGPRTFEFIVNAGLGNASGSLMGGITQGLKYEQYENTGSIGLTAYGVADYNSSVPAPELVDTHIVYASDGVDTQLYVNGELQYTFSGVALTGTGEQGLATAAGLPPLSATYLDRLDGHILGFAGYAQALTQAKLTEHYLALTGTGTPVSPDGFQISSVTLNPSTGAITLVWPSETGQIFDIKYSADPVSFPDTAAAGIPASASSSTSHTFASPSPSSSRLFFRVVRR